MYYIITNKIQTYIRVCKYSETSLILIFIEYSKEA